METTLYTILSLCCVLLIFALVLRVTPAEAAQMAYGIWEALTQKDKPTADGMKVQSETQGK